MFNLDPVVKGDTPQLFAASRQMADSSSSIRSKEMMYSSEFLANPKLPVVIVHGIWDSANTVQPLARAVKNAGHPTFAISLTPNDASVSLRLSAQQLGEFIAEHIGENCPFGLVGFSMGGLISSIYLQELEGYKRASHFVAISAPLHGTILAYGSFSRGGREMRQSSELLQSLSLTRHQLQSLKVTTIRTPFDAMIVPSESSALAGADNHKVSVLVHAWMLKDPRVHSVVLRALTA
jgi:triacylglycerol lipase